MKKMSLQLHKKWTLNRNRMNNGETYMEWNEMMIIFANDTFFQGFQGVTCNANKTLFCSLLHNTILRMHIKMSTELMKGKPSQNTHYEQKISIL